jgi:cyclopropane fatty-acyl-phospholipid synthase-like methyltransferase
MTQQREVHSERIMPKPESLAVFLQEFPDHKQRYEFAIDYVRGKRVADIACGCGYGSYIMADVAAHVDGYDIEAGVISHANAYFSKDNVNYYCNKPLRKEQYDVVISFETLEHMSEQDGDMFLSNLYQGLVDGGYLLLSTPLNRTQFKHNVTPFHVREYDHEELLLKLKKAGFKVTKIYGQENITSRRVHQPSRLGFSLTDFLKIGIHRFIPRSIRSALKELLQLNRMAGAQPVWLIPDNLDGAFVQLVVCQR